MIYFGLYMLVYGDGVFLAVYYEDENVLIRPSALWHQRSFDRVGTNPCMGTTLQIPMLEGRAICGSRQRMKH